MMSANLNYQKEISRYQARIGLVALIFLVSIGTISWWINRLVRQPALVPAAAEVQLQQLEFEVLWQGLASKSEPVVLEPVSEAQKGIGKIEPFQ